MQKSHWGEKINAASKKTIPAFGTKLGTMAEPKGEWELIPPQFSDIMKTYFGQKFRVRVCLLNLPLLKPRTVLQIDRKKWTLAKLF